MTLLIPIQERRGTPQNPLVDEIDNDIEKIEDEENINVNNVESNKDVKQISFLSASVLQLVNYKIFVVEEVSKGLLEKRDKKVKALEAAKRREQEKENETKMKKEALKQVAKKRKQVANKYNNNNTSSNIADLLPQKFVSSLLRRREGRSLNLNPEVVAEAFMSVKDPLVIVFRGDLIPNIHAPCAIFVYLNKSKEEIMRVLFPRKNTHSINSSSTTEVEQTGDDALVEVALESQSGDGSTLDAKNKIAKGNNKGKKGKHIKECAKKSTLSYKTHQAIVLIITFLAYASYHATRKTTSIIKSSLDPESPENSFLQSSKAISWLLGSGWAPFNGENGTALLGDLDLAFLFVYSIGMFFSGHIGDRMNLRIFLTIGMVGTVIGKWFGKSKRGLIMGVWNAHTSIGNISGSLIASYFLKYGWGWSMVVPGVMIIFVGLLLFMFLPVDPESVGVDKDENGKPDFPEKLGAEVTKPLLIGKINIEKESAVGFLEAWKIPGVAPFAFCLFFAKLVAYTFLYWLPFYISHTAIDGEYLSDEAAGNLSTLFDVGGVVGGILAGHISDRLNARAITAASFMYCANYRHGWLSKRFLNEGTYCIWLIINTAECLRYFVRLRPANGKSGLLRADNQ
ncbi:major facilitator superfamily domain protein [Artemisia annua]|uniref:Major facilitator superfamily domain protein n=1 Tax=Artemisia annua TaxID=35608 RepID=A0A2U1PC37_ARTAN|nr:major facilitator superfamily domain protein [Artemisia annua]